MEKIKGKELLFFYCFVFAISKYYVLLVVYLHVEVIS